MKKEPNYNSLTNACNTAKIAFKKDMQLDANKEENKALFLQYWQTQSTDIVGQRLAILIVEMSAIKESLLTHER
jgi:hypothetical protein